VWVNTTFYTDPNITVNPLIGEGAPSGGNFQTIDSTYQGYLISQDGKTNPHPTTTYKRGRTVLIQASQPQLFSFYVMSDLSHTQGEHNIIEMWDAGAPNVTGDERPIFYYHHTPTAIGFVQNTTKYESIPPHGNPLIPGHWYNILLLVNWANTNFDFWVRYTDGTLPEYQRLYQAIPFIDPDAQSFSQINFYNNQQGTISNAAELRFCNSAGTQYVPVTKQTAVQTSISKFRQTVNGQVDFNFQQSLGQYTFSQSSNYQLKGGDSSQVDLLDLRKLYNTFEVWKGTIIENPAPITYVLKKISSLFPDEEVDGINQRDQMSFAIDQYLLSTETTDIIIDNSPDLEALRGIPT